MYNNISGISGVSRFQKRLSLKSDTEGGFNPAGREISTLRWTKLRRLRRKFKVNFKYIKVDQILQN